MIIDKAECLFFVKTPKSLIPNEVKNKTFSPWIYSEIVMSQLIRKKSIAEHRRLQEMFFSVRKSMISLEEVAPIITHDLYLEYLQTIDGDIIKQWLKEYSKGYALDVLYRIIGGN